MLGGDIKQQKNKTKEKIKNLQRWNETEFQCLLEVACCVNSLESQVSGKTKQQNRMFRFASSCQSRLDLPCRRRIVIVLKPQPQDPLPPLRPLLHLASSRSQRLRVTKFSKTCRALPVLSIRRHPSGTTPTPHPQPHLSPPPPSAASLTACLRSNWVRGG